MQNLFATLGMPTHWPRIVSTKSDGGVVKFIQKYM